MRKYSYNEVRAYYESKGDIPHIIQVVLTEMEKVLEDDGYTPDDLIWEWPEGDKQVKEAYDRAMGVI